MKNAFFLILVVVGFLVGKIILFLDKYCTYFQIIFFGILKDGGAMSACVKIPKLDKLIFLATRGYSFLFLCPESNVGVFYP